MTNLRAWATVSATWTAKPLPRSATAAFSMRSGEAATAKLSSMGGMSAVTGRLHDPHRFLLVTGLIVRNHCRRAEERTFFYLTEMEVTMQVNGIDIGKDHRGA